MGKSQPNWKVGGQYDIIVLRCTVSQVTPLIRSEIKKASLREPP